jgi:hypothetical protein
VKENRVNLRQQAAMNAEMPIKAASRHDPAISIFYTQKPVKLFLAFCAGRVVTQGVNKPLEAWD